MCTYNAKRHHEILKTAGRLLRVRIKMKRKINIHFFMRYIVKAKIFYNIHT